MSQLPLRLPLIQMQSQWKSLLDPLIANPITNGLQIDGITLVANTPLIVNHSLGQVPSGWFIVDNQTYAPVKRTQPFNTKTITLESNANCVVSIWIF
jgi:hypothetical protein